MDFDVIGEISAVETIARGTGVQERASLTSAFGAGLWRKRKGVATVRLPDGTIAAAELHWFEAHGIGRRRMKIKRFFD